MNLPRAEHPRPATGLYRHFDDELAPIAAVQRAAAWLRRALWFAGRGGLAAVWLYQGLVCKLLLARPSHAQVVEQVPVLGECAAAALLALGVLETLLALWILDGRYPLLAAATQSVLLLAMNTGGLLFAADRIHDPAGMVLQNIAFLALAWLVALHRTNATARAHDRAPNRAHHDATHAMERSLA